MSSPEKNNTTEEETMPSETIGDTAYSQCFVLGLLKKMLKLFNGEDIENWRDAVSEVDLCTLWDMTTEKDVAAFLLQHSAVDIFENILEHSDDFRLLEIIVGIVGNMSCEKDIAVGFKTHNNLVLTVFSHLQSSDSLLLLQILRFASSVIYHDAADLKLWLEFFRDSKFDDSIGFILNNSINKDVLVESLETLNSVCVSWDRKESLFFELFANKQFIESLIVAFSELSKLVEKHKIESNDQERINLAFLTIISTLSMSSNFSDLIDDDNTEKLLLHMNKILKSLWKIKSKSICEMIESITYINYALKFPMTDESIETCKTLVPIWQHINQNDKNDKDSFSEDNLCDQEKHIIDIDPTLANYFARIIKSWPSETIDEIFKSANKMIVKILITNIEKLISMEKLSLNYNDVCISLKRLLENENT